VWINELRALLVLYDHTTAPGHHMAYTLQHGTTAVSCTPINRLLSRCCIDFVRLPRKFLWLKFSVATQGQPSCIGSSRSRQIHASPYYTVGGIGVTLFYTLHGGIVRTVLPNTRCHSFGISTALRRGPSSRTWTPICHQSDHGECMWTTMYCGTCVVLTMRGYSARWRPRKAQAVNAKAEGG
jgi:hypothetical protein